MDDFTTIVVGDKINFSSLHTAKSIQDCVSNLRRQKIARNSSLLISGSTPHAGDVFPKSMRVRGSKCSSMRIHYRVFFQGDPTIGKYSHEVLRPQFKINNLRLTDHQI